MTIGLIFISSKHQSSDVIKIIQKNKKKLQRMCKTYILFSDENKNNLQRDIISNSDIKNLIYDVTDDTEILLKAYNNFGHTASILNKKIVFY
tara:strand:+ start:1406 stop:1681 length:276 start_codon:yes stop_codon:yes gene_type:complete